jgi:hypothetical protein
MAQIFVGGSNNDLSASTTEYVGIHGDGVWGSNRGDREQCIMADGKISHLYIHLRFDVTGGERVFTLYKNGSPTALTCTVSAGNYQASDTTNEVTVSATDELALQHNPDSPTEGSNDAYWSLKFQPDTLGQTVFVGGYGDDVSTSTGQYNHLHGGYTWVSSEAGRRGDIPTTGTINALYVKLDGPPGADTSYWYKFTVVVNGAASDLVTTITGTDEAGSNMADSVVVNDGDRVSIYCEPSSPFIPTARSAVWGTRFDTTQGNSVIMGQCPDTMSPSVTEYAVANAGRSDWGTSGYNTWQLLQPCTLKHFRVTTGDLGTSKKQTFDFDVEETTELSVEIEGSELTGTDTDDITISEWDRCWVKHTPYSSPTARTARWGILIYLEDDIPQDLSTTLAETITLTDTLTNNYSAVVEGISTENCDYDPLETASEGRMLARDSSGHLHAVWLDTDEYVMYSESTDNGENWDATPTTISAGDNMYGPSIAVDNNDTIWVTYSDWGNDDLVCTSYVAGLGWEESTIASEGYGTPVYNEVKTDGYNNVHVAYTNLGYHLKYIMFDASGGTWTAESTVDTQSAPWATSSGRLVIGYDNEVYHISNHQWATAGTNFGKNRLVVLQKGISTWNAICTIVGDSGEYIDISGRPSVAIDGDNNLYIAAGTAQNTRRILYSKWNLDTASKVDGWTTLSSDVAPHWPTIALEQQGGVNVAWVGPAPGSSTYLMENNTVGADTYSLASPDHWLAQWCNPGTNGPYDTGDSESWSHFKLKLHRTGTIPGDVEIASGTRGTDLFTDNAWETATMAGSAVTTNTAGEWYTFTMNSDYFWHWIGIRVTSVSSESALVIHCSTNDAYSGGLDESFNDGADWSDVGIGSTDALFESYARNSLVHVRHYSTSWEAEEIPSGQDLTKFHGGIDLVDSAYPGQPLWGRFYNRPDTGYAAIYSEGNSWGVYFMSSAQWNDSSPYDGTLTEILTLEDTLKALPSTLNLSENITLTDGLAKQYIEAPLELGYSVLVEEDAGEFYRLRNVKATWFEDANIVLTDIPEFGVETDNVTGRRINKHNVGKGCLIYRNAVKMFNGVIEPRSFSKGSGKHTMDFGGPHQGYQHLTNRVCDYYRADNNSYAPVVNPWRFGRKTSDTDNTLIDGVRPEEIMKCLIGTKFIWQEWFENHDFLRWTTTKPELVVYDGVLKLPKTSDTSDDADAYATSGYVESIGLYNGDKHVDEMGNIISVTAKLVGSKSATYDPGIFVCRDADQSSPTWNEMTLTYDGSSVWTGTFEFTDDPTYKNQFGYYITLDGDGTDSTEIDYARFDCVTLSDTSITEGTIDRYNDPNTSDDTVAINLAGSTRLDAMEKVRKLTNTSTEYADVHCDAYIDNDLQFHFTTQRGEDVSQTFSFANKNLTLLNQDYDGLIKNALIAVGAGEQPYAVTITGSEMKDTESIATYGQQTGYFIDTSIPDAPTLYKRARAYLEFMKEPRETLDVKITHDPELAWNTGDRVTIEDTEFDINNLYRVVSRKVTKHADNIEQIDIKLGTKSDTVGGLLKNIQDKFGNQEIITQGTGAPTNTLAAGLVYDSSRSAEYQFYVPKNAQRVVISAKTHKFRAYSTAASGGTSHTHSISGETTDETTAGMAAYWSNPYTMVNKNVSANSWGYFKTSQLSGYDEGKLFVWAQIIPDTAGTIGKVRCGFGNSSAMTSEHYALDLHDYTNNADYIDYISCPFIAGSGYKDYYMWIHIYNPTGSARDYDVNIYAYKEATHDHDITGMATTADTAHTHGLNFGIYEFDYYPAQTCMRIDASDNPAIQKFGYIGTENTSAEVTDLDITDNLRDSNGKIVEGLHTLYFDSQTSSNNADGLGIISVSHKITVNTADDVDLSPIP